MDVLFCLDPSYVNEVPIEKVYMKESFKVCLKREFSVKLNKNSLLCFAPILCMVTRAKKFSSFFPRFNFWYGEKKHGKFFFPFDAENEA